VEQLGVYQEFLLSVYHKAKQTDKSINIKCISEKKHFVCLVTVMKYVPDIDSFFILPIYCNDESCIQSMENSSLEISLSRLCSLIHKTHESVLRQKATEI